MSLKLTDRNILIKNVSVQINSARRDADIFSWKESRPITYGFTKPYCRGNVTFLHSRSVGSQVTGMFAPQK